MVASPVSGHSFINDNRDMNRGMIAIRYDDKPSFWTEEGKVQYFINDTWKMNTFTIVGYLESTQCAWTSCSKAPTCLKLRIPKTTQTTRRAIKARHLQLHCLAQTHKWGRILTMTHKEVWLNEANLAASIDKEHVRCWIETLWQVWVGEKPCCYHCSGWVVRQRSSTCWCELCC